MVDLLALITPIVVLVTSLCVIFAIRALDVVEKESKRLIGIGLLLGAIATVPAIIWQVVSGLLWHSLGASEVTANMLTIVVDAPISEELCKGLALIILIRSQRRKLDSLTDYLVCACAIGIGFELVENILYQWSAFDQENPIGAWIDEFNNRVLDSAGSHAFFSIWLGLAGWILFQASAPRIRPLAPASVLLSILLHGFNNLTALMVASEPEHALTLINRIGMTLTVVGNHLSLALFIGLIGVAILRDIRFLSDFSGIVQSRLLRQSDAPDVELLLVLQELTNPLNHLLAGSAWSWNWSQNGKRHVNQRTTFRRFAKLALASALRGPADPYECLSRSSCVDQGLSLIKNAALRD